MRGCSKNNALEVGGVKTNYLNSLYQQVLLSISIILQDCEKQVKVGRPPKVSDLQIACLKAVNSQIKLFNGVSRWRNITNLLAYLQGYAIGYSFFRKSWLFK